MVCAMCHISLFDDIVLAMATRKTTRGKTKTTKSSATAARRASAKAKVVSGKSTQQNISGLLNLHKMTVAVFVLLIILAAVFMNNTGLQLFVGHLAQDSLTNTVAPAVHHLFDIQVRWLVVTTLAVSVIVPLLYLTRYKQRYQKALNNKIVPWRWIDLGLSGIVMLETIAWVSGVNDLITLKFLGLSIISIAIMAWLAERATTKAALASLNLMIVLLAVLLVIPLVATSIFGVIRAPWYVYTLYGGVIAAFIAHSVNHRRLFKGQQTYVTTERNYLLLNLVSKTAFAVILIVGFMK